MKDRIRVSIVLGAGFGDEGKGLVTEHLCRKSGAYDQVLVVRFSGGQQAGHTVMHKDGTKHIFSSFGAGSMLGCDTYISHFCTFYPTTFLKEQEVLLEKCYPKEAYFNYYLDRLAMVTTPYDVLANKLFANKGETVGLGVGMTMQRNLTPYKLYAVDLWAPKTVIFAKLQAIKEYYVNKTGLINEFNEFDKDIELFIDQCKDVTETTKLGSKADFAEYNHLIFEGSQGILLDQDHGFFPQVTYASTTCKNALTILGEYYNLDEFQTPTVYYTSRCYLTRHGNGFLPYETDLGLVNNEHEINVYNKYQGQFRTALFNLDLLKYSMAINESYIFNISPTWSVNKCLVLTCLNQLGNQFSMVKDDKVLFFGRAGFLQALADEFFPKLEIFVSDTPYSEDIQPLMVLRNLEGTAVVI